MPAHRRKDDDNGRRHDETARLQTRRLETLISASISACGAAERGLLFASLPGRALVNAAFDLFECDDLYRLGQDVGHELEREP